MIRRLIAPVLLLAACVSLDARNGQERLRGLLETGFDAEECYRVRDLFLEREDVKLYFTDGFLIFAEPHEGRDVAALFLAEAPQDSGELVLIPPDARERQSALQFTGQTVINERFRSALMLFTDDTADVLRAALAASPLSENDVVAGRRMAERWTPVLRNILESVSLRLLLDIVSEAPLQEGMFAAAIGGGRLGRFDVVIDPRQEQQISIGQSVSRNNEMFYEVWAQFEARSFRDGRREPPAAHGRLENYDIEATIANDLSMSVTARADFIPASDKYRAFALALSRKLRAEELLVDGQPADLLRTGATTGAREDETVFFILPEKPVAGRPLRLELKYGGRIISRAGEGVFFVSSRANWYPISERTFSRFRLTFHYPTELDLVATGKQVAHEEAYGMRTTVFETESPTRLAGFNLGRYVSAERTVKGHKVAVRANLAVEENLRPPLPQVIYIPNPRPRRRGFEAPRIIVPPAPPAPPSPADRVDSTAERSAAAFEYFLDKFGPPPTSGIVISPIPAGFGQGFPGLVFASTLSYYEPEDPPLESLPREQQVFYSKLLLPHEISHQWWGNTVAVKNGSDNWVLEALATYSALLYLEHTEGATARDLALEQYRRSLLTPNEDGNPVESAGPLVLGDRLRSSKFPSAYRVILYQKGAWVIHMLRGRLGDERFFQFLRELPERRRGSYLDVEEFRSIAAEYAPEGAPDAALEDFFDQWVYRTGVPRLSLKWKQDDGRVRGELRRQGGLERAWMAVPVRAELASGATKDWLIWSDGEATEFEQTVETKIERVVVDPDRTLLLERR